MKAMSNAARVEEIRRLRKEGMTFNALAKKYGLTKQRIKQIVDFQKTDTLGIDPKVYMPIKRAMLRLDNTFVERGFTLEDLEATIEEGLQVRGIGESRVKELSDILGREVEMTRVYPTTTINGHTYKDTMYYVLLKFKEVRE
jgi:hypothetical protein